MKQLVLVAVLAAIGSSALTLLLDGFSGAPAPSPPAAGAAPDLKAALADVERELAEIRRILAERGKDAALAPVTASPAGSPGATGGAEVSAAASPLPATPSPTPVSAAVQHQRFVEVVSLRNAEGFRDEKARREAVRRWMFHPEQEVLDWFGRPTSINGNGDLEQWNYEVPTGEVDENREPVVRRYWITINKGRLIDLGD